MDKNERLIDTVKALKDVKTSSVLRVIQILWKLFLVLAIALLVVIFFSNIDFYRWTSPEIISTLIGLVMCGLELKSNFFSRLILSIFRS
jgi:hypothetical protein